MPELEPPLAELADPLAFLRASHRLILAHCEHLSQLAERLATTPPTPELRQEARALHGFFTTVLARHQQDEEVELYARLNRISLKMADAVHAMRRDHGRLNELWAGLAPRLAAPDGIAEHAQFQSLVAEFVTLKRQHMQREEQELFNRGQHILSSAELKQISTSMAGRRGIKH